MSIICGGGFAGQTLVRQLKLNDPDIAYASFEEVKENYQYAKEKVEEFAQVVFLLILEDIMPEKLAMFPEPIWLNAWAMSLNSNNWQEDGLFEPHSAPPRFKGYD